MPYAVWSPRRLATSLLLIVAACDAGSGATVPDAQVDAGSDAAGDSGGADAGPQDSGDVSGTEPRCGDGVVDPLEACDDGNTATEVECPWGTPFCDACTADCSESLFLEGNTCGDGVRDPVAEVCDRDDLGGATCADVVAGSLDGTPRCAFDCQSIEAGSCRAATCGDGVVEGDERCDDGNTVSESQCAPGTATCAACSADCAGVLELRGPVCGDGVRDADEVCDDGNTLTEASCPYGVPTCEVCTAACDGVELRTGGRCGDGAVDGPEVCDGFGLEVPDACPRGVASCSFCAADCSGRVERTGTVCGDAVVDAAFEQCDGPNLLGATCEALSDGFVGGTLACQADCAGFDTTACEGRPCGNGVVDDGEACDDGNVATETECPWGVSDCERCSADCTATLALTGGVCGDGVVNGPEVCDVPEPATACAYGEATCETCNATCDGTTVVTGPFCGDGVVDAVEVCDDGAANGTVGLCSPWSCGALVEQLGPLEGVVATEEWGYLPVMNDRWLVVAQPFEEVAGEPRSGTLYVWERTATGLEFSARIRSPIATSFTGFGLNVHVVGDEILTTCSECLSGRGALLSYRHDGAVWNLSQTVGTGLSSVFNVGNISAFSDDLVVLTAPISPIGDQYGVPFVYERRPDGLWGSPTPLIASDPTTEPGCGVAIAPGRIAAGGCFYNGRRGVIVLFERRGDTWVEAQLLEPGELDGTWPSTLSNFGASMAFVGPDLLVAGVDALERPDGTGWMVAFERGATGWSRVDGPRVDESGRPQGVGGRMLGTATRLASNYLRTVDGVTFAETTFFERRGGDWIRQAAVRHSVNPVYSRNETLSVWGDRFLIGSPATDTFGRNVGAVWIY